MKKLIKKKEYPKCLCNVCVNIMEKQESPLGVSIFGDISMNKTKYKKIIIITDIIGFPKFPKRTGKKGQLKIGDFCGN